MILDRRIPVLLAWAMLAARAQSQVPVAQRTHTFAGYRAEPILRPLVPVFVSTVKVLRTYVDVSTRGYPAARMNAHDACAMGRRADPLPSIHVHHHDRLRVD